MATIYKEVVGEPELLEQRKAATERRPQHEMIVRLALDNVPDADEFRVVAEHLELTPRVVCLEIDPSDDARNGRVNVGECKQPARFFERLARLHRDTCVVAGAGHFVLRLVWQKI